VEEEQQHNRSRRCTSAQIYRSSALPHVRYLGRGNTLGRTPGGWTPAEALSAPARAALYDEERRAHARWSKDSLCHSLLSAIKHYGIKPHIHLRWGWVLGSNWISAMPSRFSDDAGQNKKISWDVRVFPHGYMCSSAWCKEIDADCSPKGNRDVGGREGSGSAGFARAASDCSLGAQ
jgi:hypothetical protein